MLKSSSDAERLRFAEKVLAFIDPKFESEAEMQNITAVLLEFASKCELTENEFILALELAAEGKLIIENGEGEFEKVKLFREINRLKLGEVKQGYILYRNSDKQYDASEKFVQIYLAPQAKEQSPEEKFEQAKKTFRVEYARLLTGELYNCYLFFDLIIKSRNIDSLKISFLEQVFGNYKPEKMKPLSPDPIKNGIEQNRQNPIVAVKESVVFAYINKNKLLDNSLEEWMIYWTDLYKKVNPIN